MHTDSTMKNDILEGSILIVEDDRLGRMLLMEIFKQQGFKVVDEARNGKEALEKVKAYCPDLVILDVMMPEMDGVEFCKIIRKDPNPQIAKLPILFQTSLDGLTDKTRFFEVGATDYVTKPVDPHEITARAIVHLERQVMTRHLRKFHERVAQELEMACRTQQVLIPDAETIQKLEKDYNLGICGHYRPSSELGGDFWGMKSLSNEELAIYVVDFAGHGVNAALNVFRLHALMQSAMSIANAPGAYLTHLNALLSNLLLPEQFATMFYGVINVSKNTLTYASAAKPESILFNGGGQTYTKLQNTGTLLGAFKETVYRTSEIPLTAGDALLIYSDALVETKTEQGVMQPIDHWAGLFQKKLGVGAADCKNSFNEVLSTFNQNCAARLCDDLTIVSILYKNA